MLDASGLAHTCSDLMEQWSCCRSLQTLTKTELEALVEAVDTWLDDVESGLADSGVAGSLPDQDARLAVLDSVIRHRLEA